MSNKTTNYNLTLPLQEEYYNVDIFNENYTVIDGEIKRLSDSMDNLARVSKSGSYNDLLDKPNTGKGATVYTINSDTFASGTTWGGNPYVEIHDCTGRIVYVGLLNLAQKEAARSCGMYLYVNSGTQGAVGIQVTSMPTTDIKLVVVDLGAFEGTESKSVIINGLE